jgi:gluconolactonase
MMQRRTFLVGTVAAAAGTALKPAHAEPLPLGDLPNWRYPDPRVEALDKRFKARVGNAAIERIATGFRWAEGPVISATAVTFCGATYPTIASCVGLRTTAI